MSEQAKGRSSTVEPNHKKNNGDFHTVSFTGNRKSDLHGNHAPASGNAGIEDSP